MKELFYRLFEWIYKPRKPIMRITAFSDTNVWIHDGETQKSGRWATPEEIEAINKLRGLTPS